MFNFIVNDREVSSGAPAASSLVDFLRSELHLYGTKIGCREGDCGACTVLVGEVRDGGLSYRTMNSCLMPLGNADGRHIVTIEGINGPGLTPVQSALLDSNGSQCGFCTPGFVMALYGFCLDEGREKNLANAIESVSGNICRCTGYKSIEKAVAVVVDKLRPLHQGPSGPLHQGPSGSMPESGAVEWLVANAFLPGYFLGIADKLKKLAPAAAADVDEPGYIIAGGTDILLQDAANAVVAPKVSLVHGAAAYDRIRCSDGKCTIGSTTTIRAVKESRELRAHLPGLDGYLKLMASPPIRNMATVAGNIANSSPIGDFSVILMALDATLVLRRQGGTRECRLKDFFVGYKKTALEPGEFIEWVHFDLPGATTRFSFEKISKRGHLDMATVNSAMVVDLSDGVVRKARFAVGGLGPTIRDLAGTAGYLVGKKIDGPTFKAAERIAQGEITPRSRAAYKRALVRQQLLIHLMNFSPETISLEALR